MKFEDITKRIRSSEKKEADTFREIESQISNLRDQLRNTIEKIEETYTTGDIQSGERLSGEKASLESRISYLETFINKRKELPCMTTEEAIEIKSDLNDLLFKTFTADKEKLDDMTKEIMDIISNGEDVMKKVRESGSTVNRLMKNPNPFGIDGRIISFYGILKKFFSSYYTNTKPNIEALIRETEK